MHGRLAALVVCTALLAVASTARAQDEEPEEEDFYSRPGFYFLAQFANQIGTFSSPEASVGIDSPGYSTGAAGAFGYRVNRLWAAELSGDWISGWDAEVAGRTKRLVGGSYGVNLKGYLKGGKFQPYGLLGLGATFMQVRDTQIPTLRNAQWDMSVRLGAGISWYVSDQVGLNLQPSVVLPVGLSDEVSDLLYVSVGVGAFIRFGE